MAEENTNPPDQGQAGIKQSHIAFSIEKLYVTDVSIEVVNAPGCYYDPDELKIEPKVKVDLQVTHRQVIPDTYEVSLHIQAETSRNGKKVYLLELTQCGLFVLRNIQGEHLRVMLEAALPNMVLPFARETIANASTRAGFPPLYIGPYNFDAEYIRRKQERESASTTTQAAAMQQAIGEQSAPGVDVSPPETGITPTTEG